MLSRVTTIEEHFVSCKKLQAVRTALLGLSLAVVANLSVSWAHGDDEHGELDQVVFSEEQEAVVDALHSYAAAVEAGDMDEVERYVVMDDRFSSIEGTYVDLGWASYRDHLAPEMAMFVNTSYGYSDIRPFVSGDLAYATMGYEMSLTIMSDEFEGGEHHIQTKGQATMVLAQEGGSWKIQHMHTARQKAENTTTSGH